ncbi:group I intron-associated PD-(D/E)XK endonuclease [Cellulosimicrobium cellulans]|uniref:group I intron-associated PD-(D/E)XK endonuclease n=1 Tax=Cellulosimicrobium cellulans TaxID=1710 RepID=UPI0036F072B9
MAATSSASMRSVRSHADRLGADHSHFVGQRRWSEDSLRAAVLSAGSWSEVIEVLGLGDATDLALVKGHAARLGLDIAHLMDSAPAPLASGFRPDSSQLGRAGSLLAAAWFTLCGCAVSWPLEPCRYDLLVGTDGGLRRVQVKTTTVRVGATWKAYLSKGDRARKTYDPDEIDDFFVIAADGSSYLIPAVTVGGLHAIHLSAYERYRVEQMYTEPAARTDEAGGSDRS